MELHQFFLYLAIILIAARLFSEVAGRHGIPPVIGELLAGLLVGPSLLGWISPDATMKLLAEIGIILLLFEVGMDTDRRAGTRAGCAARVSWWREAHHTVHCSKGFCPRVSP